MRSPKFLLARPYLVADTEIERLAQTDCLSGRKVLYCGDIHTHGFAILDRLRASMPHVRSPPMDAPTLLAHRHVCDCEASAKRYSGDWSRLTGAERDLFDALREGSFGACLRLEHERIGYERATAAILAA